MMFPGPFTLSCCTAKGDVHAAETLLSPCSTALPCSEESHRAEVLFATGLAWKRCSAEDVARGMLCPTARLRSPFSGDKLVHTGVKRVQ